MLATAIQLDPGLRGGDAGRTRVDGRRMQGWW